MSVGARILLRAFERGGCRPDLSRLRLHSVALVPMFIADRPRLVFFLPLRFSP
jgi:hypothetical protein